MEIRTRTSKGAKNYVCSAVGFHHTAALILSLVAFACNESADWCTGKSYCAPPIYKSTYVYFSVITLGAFLISGVSYILHCTAVYEKLPCSMKRKFLAELLCTGVMLFLLAFGNMFMISRTGNRIVYMISTIFGCLAMTMFGVQLVLVFLQNYSLLVSDGSVVHGTDDEDDVDSTNSGYPAEVMIQATAIKRCSSGDRTPGQLRAEKNNSKTSDQMFYVAECDDSDTFSSSEENETQEKRSSPTG